MTIDTNIIIAFLAGEDRVITKMTGWKRTGRQMILPTVVEAEVLSFRGMSEDERSKTTQFLENHFTSATFGRTCARLAAAIRSTTKIKLPDAAIAATAMLADVPVVTRNIKDFKKIHGLRTIVL